MQNSLAPYTPRNPRLSDYYRCVEDFFEELERVHEDRYQARLGYLSCPLPVFTPTTGDVGRSGGIWKQGAHDLPHFGYVVQSL